jgi:hypothetical protein
MGPFKITVLFELRADGGLRAYSDGVPGLALSSMDGNAALADITEIAQLDLIGTPERSGTIRAV